MLSAPLVCSTGWFLHQLLALISAGNCCLSCQIPPVSLTARVEQCRCISELLSLGHFKNFDGGLDVEKQVQLFFWYEGLIYWIFSFACF